METGYVEEADVAKYSKAKKKVSWFKRKFAEWSREAWENERQNTNLVGAQEITTKSLRIGRDHVSSIDQPERAIQFTIYNASGGRVVETRRYDRQKDRHTNGLYVITSDQDFGREIDKIITMESLK